MITRSFIGSLVAHSVLVYIALNHSSAELTQVDAQVRLEHFVKVRLQLDLETPAAPASETSIEEEEQITAAEIPTPRHPKPAKKLIAKPKPKVKPTAEIKPIESDSEPQRLRTNAPTSPSSKIAASVADASEGPKDVDSPTLANSSETSATASKKISKMKRRALKKAYWSSINNFFKNSGYDYPKRALMDGQEGKVYITIEIAPNGAIVSAKISRSSGFPILDKAALASVMAAKQLPPLPPGISQKNQKFRIPIEYRLPS